jgi:Golgi nucleoside diphosphatase
MASSRLEKQQERANALYTCLQTHIERLNQTDTKEVHTLRGLRDGLIKLATAARAEAKALQQVGIHASGPYHTLIDQVRQLANQKRPCWRQ